LRRAPLVVGWPAASRDSLAAVRRPAAYRGARPAASRRPAASGPPPHNGRDGRRAEPDIRPSSQERAAGLPDSVSHLPDGGCERARHGLAFNRGVCASRRPAGESRTALEIEIEIETKLGGGRVRACLAPQNALARPREWRLRSSNKHRRRHPGRARSASQPALAVRE
jgi:hypothetical protein